MRGILLAGILLALLAIPQPATAACSQAIYRNFINQVDAMERGSRKCDRAVNSKTMDVMQMCRICAPTIRRMIAIERMLRRNKSCFYSSSSKKSLREFNSFQGTVMFLKRGCGL
ncbi:MAG: hypothetical protein JNJ53_14480 [Rhizobiales bacterium]|nr:hypothetical protein [Hyphomicrobiales bacterium]